MFKVGDVVVVKPGITRVTCEHGDYETGDMCTVTEVDIGKMGRSVENFRCDIGDRLSYVVSVQEVRPLTKLDKALR